MKNYNETAAEIAAMQKHLGIMDNVIAAGINKSSAHLYADIINGIVYVSSGYSMGEVVIIRCNGNELWRINQSREYARRCKYSAKHGCIYLDMTKKDLKQLFVLCGERAECKRLLGLSEGFCSNDKKEQCRKRLVELHEEARILIEKSVNKEQSTIKKLFV